jgi:DNA-binding response OmpR family regulator
MNLLVVEDERRMLELLHRGLTEEGHTVFCAIDGDEGLAMLCDRQFDAVILDVMMPRVDGFEMAHQMRAANDFTPLLMLTAKDAVPDIVKGLDIGADDYLTKPFSFDELLLRLNAVTRGTRISRPLPAEMGALVIDRAAREVFRNGVRVSLTKREYCLLERLARNPGVVVSREELIASVWGSQNEVETNTLDAYVRLLRNKIEGDHRGQMIRTIRGVGYVVGQEEQA